MTYATIMTHAQADPEAAPRLFCAVAVANRFNARLFGVGAEMLPPLAFDGGFYTLEADWAVAMTETIEERLKLAHKAFKERCKDLASDDAVWSCGIQLPGPALASASRGADLIVAGGATRRETDPYKFASAAELAITSGRPVLVAPPLAPPLAAKKILVAWKDTREARRAIADAMPFLEAADSVVVVAVCGEADADFSRACIDQVVSGLQRHGVKAEAKVAIHHPADGHEVLRQASLIDADLIVMGCYGHTRLGEWMFGGVTRDLLLQDQCYLLLSH